MENHKPKLGVAGNPQAENFFRKSVELFDLISQKSGTFIKKQYRIAHLSLELQFVDHDLARVISRSLAHLESLTAGEADLTIRVLSGNIDGTGPEDFFVRLTTDDLERSSEREMYPVYSFSGEKIKALFEAGSGALSLLDGQQRLGIYWVANGSNLPFYLAASPLRNMLQCWLADEGIQILHGGAVGLDQGGIFFGGRSGSGKSTSSLVSIRNSPLKYLGDDFVLFKCDPIPTLYSLYSSGKLEPANLDRFSELGPYISNKEKLGQEKAVVYFNDEFAFKLIKRFPLKAILLPKISNRKTSQISPATAIECFKAIAPDSMFHFSSSRRKVFSELSRLVRLVPGFNLELGNDMSSIPELILDLIERSHLDQEMRLLGTDAGRL